MKLITSDIWDFIEEDRVGKLLEDMSNYDSDYNAEAQSWVEDDDWNNNFRALQDIGRKMKKGQKIKLHAEQFNKFQDIDSDVSDVRSLRERDLEKAYDSDIQLEPKKIHLQSITDKRKAPLQLNSGDLG